jgi:5'-nucleotidase
MRILVTNDDGYGAEGLTALVRILSRDHEVRTFAPDAERSGISHALTLAAAGKVRRLSETEYTCSGTPADCVLLAMLGAIDFAPELVVSGINRGPNLGTDIVYSGTCAAAREAVLCGVPGIAVSCATRGEGLGYGAAASFVGENLNRLAEACTGGVFVNVNAPSSERGDIEAVWSLPCSRVYANALKSFEGPDGSLYCFLTGGDTEQPHDAGSDYRAIREGKISVSAILVQPQSPAGFIAGREFR